MSSLRFQNTREKKRGLCEESKIAMMYELLLKVNDERNSIFYKSIQPDLLSDNSRIKSSVKKVKNSLLISVESDDVVALRSGINNFLRKFQLIGGLV